MPIFPGPSNSAFATAAALPIVFNTLTFGGAGTQTTTELHTDGLPGLNAWFLQTAGVGIVTVTIQFADGVIAPGLPDWQPLVPPFVLAAGVPNLSNHRLGSRRHRASLTATAAATVRYRLTGSLS